MSPKLEITEKEINMANRVRRQHQNEELFDKRKQPVQESKRENNTLPNGSPTQKEQKVKVDLRDYFIAAALNGLCANHSGLFAVLDNKRLIEHVTKTARMIADEMLIERER